MDLGCVQCESKTRSRYYIQCSNKEKLRTGQMIDFGRTYKTIT